MITKAREAKIKAEQDAINTQIAMDTLYNYLISEYDGNSILGDTGTGENIPEPEPIASNIKIVANNDGSGDALGANSTNLGETLYITFSHSIEGGTTTVEPAVPYAVTANGTYSFTITGTVNGETYTKTVNITVDQFKTLIDAMAIGDYVNYTYDTVANYTNLTGTGSTSNPSDGIAQSSTTLQWRILNIDEENGTIDLVSATPTSNTVYFYGALAYNNGVYLLNDMCAHLYSNSSLGITARSINLADMEKHLTTTENGGFAARNAYTSSTSTKYGTPYKYETNIWYPNLYANEIGQGIGVTDGSTITQPSIDGTVDPYNESSNYYTTPTTETSTQADTALTVTQTYYYIPISEANYGPAAAVLSNSDSYWVASRYVNTGSSSRAYFGLRYANTDLVGGSMFLSHGYPDNYNSYYLSLRPVVSLSTDLLDGNKDDSGAWNLKTE